jgi:hypothetical protein
MRKRKDKSGPLSGVIVQLLAIPYSFLAGFVTGLVLPVAAIGAVVAGIRLVTGMVPFLGEVSVDEEGGRALSLRLVPPDQVGDLYAGHKEGSVGPIPIGSRCSALSAPAAVQKATGRSRSAVADGIV